MHSSCSPKCPGPPASCSHLSKELLSGESPKGCFSLFRCFNFSVLILLSLPPSQAGPWVPPLLWLLVCEHNIHHLQPRGFLPFRLLAGPGERLEDSCIYNSSCICDSISTCFCVVHPCNLSSCFLTLPHEIALLSPGAGCSPSVCSSHRGFQARESYKSL